MYVYINSNQIRINFNKVTKFKFDNICLLVGLQKYKYFMTNMFIM